MRNYNVMRNILVTVLFAKNEVEFNELTGLSNDEKLKEEYQKELKRLKKEGLIIHNMKWDACFNGGTIKKLTPEGENFARRIQDDSVWAGVYETLKRSQLDISYPLIEKICNHIAEKIVMSCIPDEFK
jgi:hypothetical protein